MNMSDHEQTRYGLHVGPEFLEAELRTALEKHLAECSECRAYSAELASLKVDLLRMMKVRWASYRPAPDIPRRVLRTPGRQPWHRQVSRVVVSVARTALAIAVVVIAGWFLLVSGPLSVWPSPQSASAPEASTNSSNRPDRARPTSLPGLAVFGDRIALAGFDVSTVPLYPGGTLSLALRWQASTVLDTAYATFVQVLDAAGNVVIQSDNIPGLDTSLTTAGTTVVDHHGLMLPDDLAAGQYQLTVGVYDTATRERLSADDGQERVPLTAIQVRPIQHRVAETFGDVGMLLGFDLANARLLPGDPIELTLYWRARTQPTTSYLISLQIFGENKTVVAQADGVPGDGARPTTSWQTNEIIVDPHIVQLPTGVPPGTYTVVLTMFDSVSGVQVSTGSGNVAVVLTTLEVAPSVPPTATPLPTWTPFAPAQATDAPSPLPASWTPRPADTASPPASGTPIPTYTPPPASWTPIPTYTPPSASWTPFPTFTPFPTWTLEPGEPPPTITFTPPSTPIDSPTPFPTPTPTP